MGDLAWEGILAPGRLGSGRPRETGLNMVIDKGLGVAATRDLLEIAGDRIDHWKCSFGTSVFVPREVLQDKLALLAANGVLTFPGGTLLEAAVVDGSARPFVERARTLGFTAVEVSDGTIELPLDRRRAIVAAVIDAGLVAITEVGKKDPALQPSTAELVRGVEHDLACGARWVIVEGRESGTGVGIYDGDGKVRTGPLDEIAAALGSVADRLIWEAPQKGQQTSLIERFGPSVNLGNIAPGEILALESLRAGLRFETLRTHAARV